MSATDDIVFSIAEDEVTIHQDGKLGQGAAGTVVIGDWNGTRVAVKFLRCCEGDFEELKEEAALLQQLKHPNVITFYGLMASDPPGIVMQLGAGGSLGGFLRKNRARFSETFFSWEVAIRIALDIASGCAYLHKRELIHRDL